MTWAKLDDGILQHPKMAAVGGVGFAVHAAGIVYCSQKLTDGFVPYGVARSILNFDQVAWVNGMTGDDLEPLHIIKTGIPGYSSLEEVGLWLWDEENRGWWVHDYLDYNPSREEVERLRDVRSQAGSIGGKQRASNAAAKRQASPKQDLEQTASESQPRSRSRTPVVVSSSSDDLQEPEPDDWDEEFQSAGTLLEETVARVFARCADSRMTGVSDIKSPGAYRATVLADLEAARGVALRAAIESHPTAPVDVLAGFVLEEPNSLHRYRKRAG